MAEDEDGVSNKKSAQNSNNGGSSQDNEQNRTDLPYFPRLLTPETEEAKCNNSENGDASPAEAKSSSSKSTGATRKEDNPFSFRHFLKRDLSLPGTSTYENTGARPKVYASTVQHSPTREPRPHPRARDRSADEARDNTCSSGSGEAECRRDLYADHGDAQLYRAGPEPPGMPSLPDFVQDHILVEQAYLSSNGPVSVDLDNLPDFTFNTNHTAGSSSSLGRRGGRGAYPGVPLDLPPGAEPPLHLSLDLTDSVNPADRRNASPRNTFPLDLPPNAGAESMRLPDFLPAHPGRTSPEPEPAPAPEHEDAAPRLLRELERTRCELAAERGRRERLERELAAVQRHAQPRDEPGLDEVRTDEGCVVSGASRRLERELAAVQRHAQPRDEPGLDEVRTDEGCVVSGASRRLERELAAVQRHAQPRDEPGLDEVRTDEGCVVSGASRRLERELAAVQPRDEPGLDEVRTDEGCVVSGASRRLERELAAVQRHAQPRDEPGLDEVRTDEGCVVSGASRRLERELAAVQPRDEPGLDESRESPETDSTVGQLRAQIRRLKEELSVSRAEVGTLRARSRGAAAELRGAAAVAEGSLRELLAGLQQLRGLSAQLDPA